MSAWMVMGSDRHRKLSLERRLRTHWPRKPFWLFSFALVKAKHLFRNSQWTEKDCGPQQQSSILEIQNRWETLPGGFTEKSSSSRFLVPEITLFATLLLFLYLLDVTQGSEWRPRARTSPRLAGCICHIQNIGKIKACRLSNGLLLINYILWGKF